MDNIKIPDKAMQKRLEEELRLQREVDEEVALDQKMDEYEQIQQQLLLETEGKNGGTAPVLEGIAEKTKPQTHQKKNTQVFEKDKLRSKLNRVQDRFRSSKYDLGFNPKPWLRRIAEGWGISQDASHTARDHRLSSKRVQEQLEAYCASNTKLPPVTVEEKGAHLFKEFPGLTSPFYFGLKDEYYSLREHWERQTILDTIRDAGYKIDEGKLLKRFEEMSKGAKPESPREELIDKTEAHQEDEDKVYKMADLESSDPNSQETSFYDNIEDVSGTLFSWSRLAYAYRLDPKASWEERFQTCIIIMMVIAVRCIADFHDEIRCDHGLHRSVYVAALLQGARRDSQHIVYNMTEITRKTLEKNNRKYITVDDTTGQCAAVVQAVSKNPKALAAYLFQLGREQTTPERLLINKYWPEQSQQDLLEARSMWQAELKGYTKTAVSLPAFVEWQVNNEAAFHVRWGNDLEHERHVGRSHSTLIRLLNEAIATTGRFEVTATFYTHGSVRLQRQTLEADIRNGQRKCHVTAVMEYLPMRDKVFEIVFRDGRLICRHAVDNDSYQTDSAYVWYTNAKLDLHDRCAIRKALAITSLYNHIVNGITSKDTKIWFTSGGREVEYMLTLLEAKGMENEVWYNNSKQDQLDDTRKSHLQGTNAKPATEKPPGDVITVSVDDVYYRTPEVGDYVLTQVSNGYGLISDGETTWKVSKNQTSMSTYDAKGNALPYAHHGQPRCEGEDLLIQRKWQRHINIAGPQIIAGSPNASIEQICARIAKMPSEERQNQSVRRLMLPGNAVYDEIMLSTQAVLTELPQPDDFYNHICSYASSSLGSPISANSVAAAIDRAVEATFGFHHPQQQLIRNETEYMLCQLVRRNELAGRTLTATRKSEVKTRSLLTEAEVDSLVNAAGFISWQKRQQRILFGMAFDVAVLPLTPFWWSVPSTVALTALMEQFYLLRFSLLYKNILRRSRSSSLDPQAVWRFTINPERFSRLIARRLHQRQGAEDHPRAYFLSGLGAAFTGLAAAASFFAWPMIFGSLAAGFACATLACAASTLPGRWLLERIHNLIPQSWREASPALNLLNLYHVPESGFSDLISIEPRDASSTDQELPLSIDSVIDATRITHEPEVRNENVEIDFANLQPPEWQAPEAADWLADLRNLVVAGSSFHDRLRNLTISEAVVESKNPPNMLEDPISAQLDEREQQDVRCSGSLVAHKFNGRDKIARADEKDEKTNEATKAKDEERFCIATRDKTIFDSPNNVAAYYWENTYEQQKKAYLNRFLSVPAIDVPVRNRILPKVFRQVVKRFTKVLENYRGKDIQEYMRRHPKQREQLQDLTDYKQDRNDGQTDKIKLNERAITSCFFVDSRPRLIKMLGKGGKWWGVALNAIMLDMMAHQIRSSRNWIFAPGYTTAELLKAVQERASIIATGKGDTVEAVLDGDGSSWDAWQLTIWLELDAALIAAARPVIKRLYPDFSAELDFAMMICTSLIAKSHLGYKQAEKETWMLIGLTYSGHPTRTTFGNTWRCYARLLIVVVYAGVTKFVATIGGDDNSMQLFSREDLAKVRAAIADLTRCRSTMLLTLELKAVNGIDATHNNFYSKNIEWERTGPQTANRKIRRLLVDIHQSSTLKTSDDQWSGRWYGIAKQIEIDLAHAIPTNDAEREMYAWVDELREYGMLLAERSHLKAGRVKTKAYEAYRDQAVETQQKSQYASLSTWVTEQQLLDEEERLFIQHHVTWTRRQLCELRDSVTILRAKYAVRGAPSQGARYE